MTAPRLAHLAALDHQEVTPREPVPSEEQHAESLPSGDVLLVLIAVLAGAFGAAFVIWWPRILAVLR